MTLLELMVVIAIVGIMAAVAVTNIQRGIPAQRTQAAARQLMMDLRSAPAIAARTNQVFSVSIRLNDPACPVDAFNRQPSWTGFTRQSLNPIAGDRTYFRTCLGAAYGGVSLGLPTGLPLRCPGEAAGVGLTEPANDSTIDAGDLMITFFPTGETDMLVAESIQFVPTGERLALGGGLMPSAMAVSIAPLTGRSRLFTMDPVDGRWECP